MMLHGRLPRQEAANASSAAERLQAEDHTDFWRSLPARSHSIRRLWLVRALPRSTCRMMMQCERLEAACKMSYSIVQSDVAAWCVICALSRANSLSVPLFVIYSEKTHHIPAFMSVFAVTRPSMAGLRTPGRSSALPSCVTHSVCVSTITQDSALQRLQQNA